MIPHNMTLFKFICVQYQFHRQTLPIMKIDRGQIQFRDYVSTGTEPLLYLRRRRPCRRPHKNVRVNVKVLEFWSFCIFFLAF